MRDFSYKPGSSSVANICTAGRVDSDIHSTYNGFSVDADYYLISRYAASYNPTRA